MEKPDLKINPKKIIIPAIIIVVLAVLAFNAFTVVGAGHTGVVVTLGKVNEGTLQEGMHFKIPFIQEVVKIDNRIQKIEVNTEAFSKDLQSVKTVLFSRQSQPPTPPRKALQTVSSSRTDL